MRILGWLAISFAATATFAAAEEPLHPWTFAGPAAAGEPEHAFATVRYESDGYRLTRCEVLTSSGDRDADSQACKTVNFRKSAQSIDSSAPVWKSKPYVGKFVPPLPRSPRERWVTDQDYPIEALRKNQQGTAVVRMEIDETGLPSSCSIVSSSGSRAIDRVASQNLCARATFQPAHLDGQPTSSIVITTVKMYFGN